MRRAAASTRIRLSETQNIIAIAEMSDGTLHMTKAEVPPGQHAIRVDVKDSDGRAGSATIQLTVTK